MCIQKILYIHMLRVLFLRLNTFVIQQGGPILSRGRSARLIAVQSKEGLPAPPPLGSQLPILLPLALLAACCPQIWRQFRCGLGLVLAPTPEPGPIRVPLATIQWYLGCFRNQLVGGAMTTCEGPTAGSTCQVLALHSRLAGLEVCLVLSKAFSQVWVAA